MSTTSTVTNWSSTFTKQVNTAKQSLRFVKKLVAISVSNIAYLRFNLPEDVFLHLDMDGLKFVILKSQIECEQGELNHIFLSLVGRPVTFKFKNGANLNNETTILTKGSCAQAHISAKKALSWTILYNRTYLYFSLNGPAKSFFQR